MRGEYEVAAGGPSTHLGTTSACAENTACVMPLTNSQGNYLRVRGEYPTPRPEPLSAWELPPRARRIPNPSCSLILVMGTTSACAENTAVVFDLLKHDGNYLRVRGEYWPRVLWRRVCRELPPRARRIRHHRGHSQNREGTTSACAENTDLVVAVAPLLGNYLRVRGEYAFCNILSAFIWELPPRARRIPDYLGDEALPVGTTSACAENTPEAAEGKPHHRNYLRVRGEYIGFCFHPCCY